MKKIYINRIAASRMKKNLHFEFYKTMHGIFGKQSTDLDYFTAPMERFTAALAAEDRALDPVRKSEATKQIHEYDRLRGNAFYAMRETVQTTLRHFDTAKSEAARRMDIIFETYKHTPKLELPAESAAIHNLLQELDRHKEDIELLGLKEWTAELAKFNDMVRTLMSQRYLETAGQPNIGVREARAECDAAYNDMVAKIEAYATLMGEKEVESLFSEMNACVDEYLRILARGKGAGEGDTPDTPEVS